LLPRREREHLQRKRWLRQLQMQQRQQREVAGVVAYVLARVAFTLKVDSSVQRPQNRQWMHLQSSLQKIQRRLRSRLYTLHSVVAQDVRELR
jgi:hypothetical protein